MTEQLYLPINGVDGAAPAKEVSLRRRARRAPGGKRSLTAQRGTADSLPSLDARLIETESGDTIPATGKPWPKIEPVTLAPDLAVKASGDDISDEASDADAARRTYTVAEFFAGIGLARLGLEQAGLKVAWANDLDRDKREMYLGHFGENEQEHYKKDDIKDVAANLAGAGLPPDVSLFWASFPCTDLSLAGGRKGLAGKHSGTFWNFTDILEKRGKDKPPVVALENVNGFATSHGGDDLRAAVHRLNEIGYFVDVLTLDAKRWLPQSRPRLFLVATLQKPLEETERNRVLRPKWLDAVLDDPTLKTYRAALPTPPPYRTGGWTELVEEIAPDAEIWWDAERMAKFQAELSQIQLRRVKELAEADGAVYRTAYRRTRDSKPAWEIRADDIAGCLRTTRGGSSKQAVVRIEKGKPLQARWMTALEYARLMGAGNYSLPQRRNQALMGFGDAVCVDVVKWLAENYLEPLLSGKLTPPDALEPGSSVH